MRSSLNFLRGTAFGATGGFVARCWRMKDEHHEIAGQVCLRCCKEVTRVPDGVVYTVQEGLYTVGQVILIMLGSLQVRLWLWRH